MALPVVAKRDVAASWLAELDCIGGTLKKLGGSGASEAQKGTAKRRSVFSRAPQWKSRLFWVEIAAPAAGENYVLQYGDAKRKPKGAFASRARPPTRSRTRRRLPAPAAAARGSR
ncbi:hypothetical protein JL720_17111 [Aureococcus anophagefferens]|nr:hypothetical protein JL720_17111 [Aureococcus anophagefferens]